MVVDGQYNGSSKQAAAPSKPVSRFIIRTATFWDHRGRIEQHDGRQHRTRAVASETAQRVASGDRAPEQRPSGRSVYGYYAIGVPDHAW
jgi:hypothetical protein